MAITLKNAIAAEMAVTTEPRDYIYVLWVRYLAECDEIEVTLGNHFKITFPGSHLYSGDETPSFEKMVDCRVSPSGLGIWWPQLDRTAYVPSLLEFRIESCPWPPFWLEPTMHDDYDDPTEPPDAA